jgi:hypothetical protein
MQTTKSTAQPLQSTIFQLLPLALSNKHTTGEYKPIQFQHFCQHVQQKFHLLTDLSLQAAEKRKGLSSYTCKDSESGDSLISWILREYSRKCDEAVLEVSDYKQLVCFSIHAESLATTRDRQDLVKVSPPNDLL